MNSLEKKSVFVICDMFATLSPSVRSPVQHIDLSKLIKSKSPQGKSETPKKEQIKPIKTIIGFEIKNINL